MNWIFLSYIWINLPTWIQKYDILLFDAVQKRDANWNVISCQVPHFMIVLINTIYHFIKPFLDKKCLFFFRNMEPLSQRHRRAFTKQSNQPNWVNIHAWSFALKYLSLTKAAHILQFIVCVSLFCNCTVVSFHCSSSLLISVPWNCCSTWF